MELALRCSRTAAVIKPDGFLDEADWDDTGIVQIRDAVAPLSHEVRCLYSDSHIHIAVRFPDETQNRVHKSRVWDPDQQRFRVSTRREDTLVLKWNMDANHGNLSLGSDTPHKADVWYWKANRSDPLGYADDKYHLYTNVPTGKAKKLISNSGYRFYLVRKGDRGQPTYQSRIGGDYVGADEIQGYDLQTPSGSRADIRAKGHWSDGHWLVEFSRLLDTGNSDDIQLTPGRSYQLGVSRYEIASVPVNTKLEIPEFGAGDVHHTLLLEFEERQLAEQR